MSVYVKPIQPTPAISGMDAKKIVAQALTQPSKASIDRNKKKLHIRKQIMKL